MRKYRIKTNNRKARDMLAHKFNMTRASITSSNKLYNLYYYVTSVT